MLNGGHGRERMNTAPARDDLSRIQGEEVSGEMPAHSSSRDSNHISNVTPFAPGPGSSATRDPQEEVERLHEYLRALPADNPLITFL